MLGITTTDAITIGTLLAAVLAGLLGLRSGDAAKKNKPLEPSASGIAAGFVDKDLMVRLTMATENIAATLKEIVGIQTDEHERAVNDRLERIEAALIKKHDDDDRANRTVDRTGERVDRTADRVMPSRRPKA
jgi:ABC-type taurine transport system ATPase subunit